MSSGNGTAPSKDLAFVRAFLADAARAAGVAHLGWAGQVLHRVERSGTVAPYPLEQHIAEIRTDGNAIATRAALLATEHPDVIAGDVDATLHVRLRLRSVVSLAATLEHELRQLEHLVAG